MCAIAVERKDIWVLSAQTRIQSKRKIGTSKKAHSAIWKQMRLTFTRTKSDDDNESTISKGSSRIGWSVLLIKQKERLYKDDRAAAKDRLKNYIILNNESTMSIF
jgi:hypothetical protein